MERDRGGRPRYPGVLTPAEQRVLDELREGGTNAAIAARLGLSRETVKTHIASMLSKLDLADRGALAAWRPEPPRRAARGWLGLLVRPAVGLGAAGGLVAVIVVFAVVIAASRDGAVPIVATPELNIEGCSGAAVSDPKANSELVADCESLLGLRDTIRGTGNLDWTGSTSMSEWTGVTISGTPQRVTALDLSDLGLDGQLSGLLGNLTGLTTLDLSGNALTGRIPSKLELLRLTSVTLPGTFTGCAPPGFTTASGLTACGDPTDTWTFDEGDALPAGAYGYTDAPGEPTVVFDVPDDAGLVFSGPRTLHKSREPTRHSNITMVLKNAEGTMSIVIDLGYAIPGAILFEDDFTSVGTASGYTRAEYEAIYKQIAESIWERPD